MKRTAAFTTVVVLTLSILVGAKGQKTHTRGSVVATTSSTIVIKTGKGNTNTIDIDPQTNVLRNGAALRLSDVKPGERVEITFTTRNDRQVAAEINVIALTSGKTK